MKNLIIALALLFSLSSCSVIKKAFHKKEVKVKKQESTQEVKEKTSEITTKSTTIREIDTTIKLPADSLRAKLVLPDSLALDTFITNQHGLDIHVKYRPQSKELQVISMLREREVPVKLRSETQSTTVEHSQEHDTKATQSAEQSTVITTDKTKEVKRWPWWIAVGAVLIGLILVYYFIYGGWWAILLKRFKAAKENGSS